MWKANGNTTTLLLFLDSLFPKTEIHMRVGRRRRKLLDDLKEKREYSHLKEEALDRTIWRARFGRGFGPVVRQTTKRMNYHTIS
jgi:hypothetical protein